MRCPTTVRLLSAVAVTAMLLSIPSVRSYAAACDCDFNVQKTLNICVQGSTYSITVDICETNHTNPLGTGYCSGAGMNRTSYIRKICFNGLIPPGTNEDINSALYCEIENLNCSANIWGFSVPLAPGSSYCWQLRAPRCTTRDYNNCIVTCGDECYWCTYEFKWTRSAGTCSVSSTGACQEGTECDTGCENECPKPTCCQ